MHRDPISFTWTTVPADNASVYVLDSTCGTARTSTAPTPGPFRRQWDGCIVRFTVKNGDQAVTVKQNILTGNAGTSSDWTLQDGGSTSVSASTVQEFEWKPSAPDFQLEITAGANNPNSLVVQVTVLWGEDYGS